MRSRPPDRWVPGQVALPSRSTDPAEGSIASQRLSQTGRDRPTPSSLSEAIFDFPGSTLRRRTAYSPPLTGRGEAVSTRTNRVALEPDLGGIRRLAESFEIGLSARNLSPRTVKGYLESVRLLAEYLARSGMPTRLDSIARRLRQRVGIPRHRHVPVRARDRLPDLQCVRPPDGRRVPRLPGDAVATYRRDPPVAGVPHLSGGARPAVHRDRNAGVLLVFPRGCSWKHLHPRHPSRRPRARLWTKDRVGRRTRALGFPTPSACSPRCSSLLQMQRWL